jgi:hypothetical protein
MRVLSKSTNSGCMKAYGLRQAKDVQRRSQWQVHQELERGNAVRVYAGERFQLKSA